MTHGTQRVQIATVSAHEAGEAMRRRVAEAVETLIGECGRVANPMGLVSAALERSMLDLLIGVVTNSMERSWWLGAARVEPLGRAWMIRVRCMLAAALNDSSSEVLIGVVTDLKQCLGIRRSEEGKAAIARIAGEIGGAREND